MVCQDLHTLLNRIKELTGNRKRISRMSSKGSSGNLNECSSIVGDNCFPRVLLGDGWDVKWPPSVAMNRDGKEIMKVILEVI